MAFCCANTRKTPKKPKKSYQHLKPNRWSVLLDVLSFIPAMVFAVEYMTWDRKYGMYAVVATLVVYALFAIQQFFMPSRIVASFLLRACVMGGMIVSVTNEYTLSKYSIVTTPIVLTFSSLSVVYYTYRICSFKRPPTAREDAVAAPAVRGEGVEDEQGSDPGGEV